MVWLRRGDLWVIAAVLLLALGAFAWQSLGGKDGATVTIVTPSETKTLPLSEDATLNIVGKNDHHLTVQVKDGAARVVESDCPDRVCVNSGWLSRAGSSAACVPAGVLVRIDGEAEVDAIA